MSYPHSSTNIIIDAIMITSTVSTYSFCSCVFKSSSDNSSNRVKSINSSSSSTTFTLDISSSYISCFMVCLFQ